MNTIILNYSYSGYRGQFFATGSLYRAISDLNQIGPTTNSGSLKKATGICTFKFNFILN